MQLGEDDATSRRLKADGEFAMIKLKVEWHFECQACGTDLVVDYFDSLSAQPCPWCGCAVESTMCECQGELKRYISRSIKEIEDRANSGVEVSR